MSKPSDWALKLANIPIAHLPANTGTLLAYAKIASMLEAARAVAFRQAAARARRYADLYCEEDDETYRRTGDMRHYPGREEGCEAVVAMLERMASAAERAAGQ